MAHDDRAGPMRLPRDVAVAGQHVDVVAQRLEVVGDVVARDVALVVQHRASSCWPSAADGSRSSSGSTTNGRRCSSCCSLAWAQHLPSPSFGTIAPDHLAVWPRSAPSWPGAALCVVVLACCGVDGVGRLDDLPGRSVSTIEFWIDACRPARSKRRLPNGVRSAARLRPPSGLDVYGAGPGGRQRRAFADRAVAVDALDLDGGADLVLQAWCCRARPGRNGNRRSACPFPGGCPAGGRASPVAAGGLAASSRLAWSLEVHGGHAALRWSTLRDHVALVVEQVALAVLLEHGAEDPAVAVEVGELGVPGLRVQVGARSPGTPGRTRVPRAAASSGLDICDWANSSAVGCFCLRGIHQLAVGFLVPPHEAEVAVHDVGAGVDVADDALAGRDAVA